MGTALAVLGALGGTAAFIGGVVMMLKAVFRQVNATDNNTRATQELTKMVGELGAAAACSGIAIATCDMARQHSAAVPGLVSWPAATRSRISLAWPRNTNSVAQALAGNAGAVRVNEW